MLSVRRHGNDIGVTFFDVTTLEIMLGQFNDDQNMSTLRTLVCQIRPVEVIIGSDMRHTNVVKMLKNSPVVPIFNYLPPQKCFGFMKTCTKIENYFGINLEEWPEVLRDFK